MKTLFLMRHAKSAWGDPDAADFDRPLAARGRLAAPSMAAHMAALGMIPDHVICSAARRTRETWELMAPVFEMKTQAVCDEGLFHAGRSRLLAALRDAPAAAASVLLIGHSPGMESLAAGLAGPGSDAAARRRLAGKFPTAALAVITFDNLSDWTRLEPVAGRLTLFVIPRDLD